jgi:hypothetical protein
VYGWPRDRITAREEPRRLLSIHVGRGLSELLSRSSNALRFAGGADGEQGRCFALDFVEYRGLRRRASSSGSRLLDRPADWPRRDERGFEVPLVDRTLELR